MRAVVTGMIATYPLGGVAWDYGQYALGLERLGFDVCYLEDTGADVFDPTSQTYGSNYDYSLKFLADSLDELSPTLARRWCVRDQAGAMHGPAADQIDSIVGSADLFLNVSGSAILRDEYMRCRCKVLLDTDPGLNHFVNYPRSDAREPVAGRNGYRAHDHFFTYAGCLGEADCVLPDMGITWHRTVPPVVMDRWHASGPGDRWTTVMSWANFRKSIEWAGRHYTAKEGEFLHIEHLPSLTSARFEVAVGGTHAPCERWRELNWNVIDAAGVSSTLTSYRGYIEASRGEFSVAKNIYVGTRSGWFSCRTACYLAAGRPAVVQDTGFTRRIATGAGLLSFTDLASALAAVEAVESDYVTHCRAAIDIAREYFDSSVVLRDMLDRMATAPQRRPAGVVT